MAVSSKMKPSAYKSMWIAKEGKTKERNNQLKRWIDEDWRNLTPMAMGLVKNIKDLPKCGNKHKLQKDNPSICRPLKRVNKDTPKTIKNYTKKQLQKALEIKKKGQRIMWNNL